MDKKKKTAFCWKWVRPCNQFLKGNLKRSKAPQDRVCHSGFHSAVYGYLKASDARSHGINIRAASIHSLKPEQWWNLQRKEENLHGPKTIVSFVGCAWESPGELSKIHTANYIPGQLSQDLRRQDSDIDYTLQQGWDPVVSSKWYNFPTSWFIHLFISVYLIYLQMYHMHHNS